MSAIDQDLERLVQRYLADELDPPAQQAALAWLQEQDREAAFWRAVAMERLLRGALVAVDPAVTARGVRRGLGTERISVRRRVARAVQQRIRPSATWSRRLLVAAGLLLLLGGATIWLVQQRATGVGEVAVVGWRLVSGEVQDPTGTQLAPGPLATAQLRCLTATRLQGDGSLLHCSAGTELTLVGRRGCELRLGQVTAAIRPGAERWIITSPGQRVTVLGTRFTVSTSATAGMVEVEEGTVLVEDRRDGTSAQLGPGAQQRWSTPGPWPDQVALDLPDIDPGTPEPVFRDLMRQARRWYPAAGDGPAQPDTATPLSPDGWPLAVPAEGLAATLLHAGCRPALDELEARVTGRGRWRWRGASVTTATAPGTVLLQRDPTVDLEFVIDATDAEDPLRCTVQPRGLAASADHPFDPRFLRALAGVPWVRASAWTPIGPTPIDPSERLGYRTADGWVQRAGHEDLIVLARLLDSHCWLDIAPNATPAYHRWVAATLATHHADQRRIHLGTGLQALRHSLPISELWRQRLPADASVAARSRDEWPRVVATLAHYRDLATRLPVTTSWMPPSWAHRDLDPLLGEVAPAVLPDALAWRLRLGRFVNDAEIASWEPGAMASAVQDFLRQDYRAVWNLDWRQATAQRYGIDQLVGLRLGIDLVYVGDQPERAGQLERVQRQLADSAFLLEAFEHWRQQVGPAALLSLQLRRSQEARRQQGVHPRFGEATGVRSLLEQLAP